MKKALIIIDIIIVLAIAGILVYVFVLKDNTKEFKVTFDSNGGSKVSSISVECGKVLSLPKNPTKKGYTFVSWTDKNGVTIYDRALLACEDITLKANWKKNSTSNNSKKDNNKKDDTKKDDNKKNDNTTTKTYKCPDGYTLNSNNKCETSTAATDSCPSNYLYSSKKQVCYLNEPTSYSRKCNTKTFNNGSKSEGELVIDKRAGNYYCGYVELTTYKGNERSCEHAGGTYCNINSKCYSSLIKDNYTITCPSGYTYYKAKELLDSQTSDLCYKTQSPSRPCPSGYTLEGNVCKKYVDPTYE